MSRVWAPTPCHTLGGHVTEQEQAEWQQLLQAAVAETLRRRAQRRQQRQDLNAARTIGLQHRHHAKTNRKDQP